MHNLLGFGHYAVPSLGRMHPGSTLVSPEYYDCYVVVMEQCLKTGKTYFCHKQRMEQSQQQTSLTPALSFLSALRKGWLLLRLLYLLLPLYISLSLFLTP